MPARTNLFQRVTKSALARLGSGWSVAESQMLVDSITGMPREVDVVMKASVSTHQLYISVECRDHARPADVTWIEQMAKKHESLPTSKLVLWSRSGFTEAAIAKAKALKIDVVSQADATTADWAKFARDAVGSRVQHVTPNFETFIDVELEDGTLQRLENVAEAEWYNAKGDCLGSVEELITSLRASPDFGATLLNHAPVGSGSFYAEFRPPDAFVEREDGQLLKISRIGIGISTDTEHVPVNAASAIIDGRVTTLASADIKFGRLELLVEETQEGAAIVEAKIVRKK